MVTYRRAGLKIAEVWFDEPDQDLCVDIVRYNQALVQPVGVVASPFFTRVIDLAQEEQALLSTMSTGTRYKIRRAAQRDGVSCHASAEPDGELLERFRGAYSAFAQSQGLPRLAWAQLQRLAAARQLDVSWATVEGLGELVYHVHVVTPKRTRLQHSVSSPSAKADPALRNMLGRANRLLHWEDLLRFKARGIAVYDFGGWYVGGEDAKLLQINSFKESFGGKVEKNFNAERLLTSRARIAVIVAKVLGRHD